VKTLGRTAARKSLPLTERDLHDLETLRESAIHREALSQAAHIELADDASEAVLLHAIHEAGMRAVRQQIEEQGYKEIGETMAGNERQRVARRRRPSWADES
jgi:hypothetical protein